MDHYSFNSQSEYEELGTGDWSNQNLWEWADWEAMCAGAMHLISSQFRPFL